MVLPHTADLNKEHCINIMVDGVACLVRTTSTTLSPEELKPIRAFVKKYTRNIEQGKVLKGSTPEKPALNDLNTDTNRSR